MRCVTVLIGSLPVLLDSARIPQGANARLREGVQEGDTANLSALEDDATTTSTTPAPACLRSLHNRHLDESGELVAGPMYYAQALGFNGSCVDEPLDYMEFSRMRATNTPVFVGGGELSNVSLIREVVKSTLAPVVLWGVALPEFDGQDKSLPVYAREPNVRLVGTREYVNKGRHEKGSKVRWVPDPSAMHAYFDKYFEMHDGVGLVPRMGTTKRKVGFVRYPGDSGFGCEHHHAGWVNEGVITEDDVMSSEANMKDIVEFISRSEAVISSSYHILYWTTLLGRRAIACDAKSTITQTKHMKWHVLEYSGNLSAAAEHAPTYPGAMQEAREANVEFAAEARRLLRIPDAVVPVVEQPKKADVVTKNVVEHAKEKK